MSKKVVGLGKPKKMMGGKKTSVPMNKDKAMV